MQIANQDDLVQCYSCDFQNYLISIMFSKIEPKGSVKVRQLFFEILVADPEQKIKNFYRFSGRQTNSKWTELIRFSPMFHFYTP